MGHVIRTRGTRRFSSRSIRGHRSRIRISGGGRSTRRMGRNRRVVAGSGILIAPVKQLSLVFSKRPSCCSRFRSRSCMPVHEKQGCEGWKAKSTPIRRRSTNIRHWGGSASCIFKPTVTTAARTVQEIPKCSHLGLHPKPPHSPRAQACRRQPGCAPPPHVMRGPPGREAGLAPGSCRQDVRRRWWLACWRAWRKFGSVRLIRPGSVSPYTKRCPLPTFVHFLLSSAFHSIASLLSHCWSRLSPTARLLEIVIYRRKLKMLSE